MAWLRAIVLWGVCCTGGLGATAAEKNIVLFVADDLGCDLGCYGNQAIRTPHIDGFAAESTRYSHAFATTASCSASRSVILSGLHNHATAQYGHTHHYHHFRTYDWIRTLPNLLQGQGYRTARVGKFHVTPDEVYPFEQVYNVNSRDMKGMTDKVRDFVAADSEQPFFLYICTSDPHRSGDTVDDDPLAANRFGNRGQGTYPGITPVQYEPDQVEVPPFLPDTPAARAELAQYYQSVSRVDQGFGLLTATLKEAGVYDDTLLILTSDHGIAMPGAKTTVYEPGLRVPLIVRSPGGSHGGVTCEAMVSLVDLTPTLVDFAGILDAATGTIPADVATQPTDIHRPGSRPQPYRFHGRSFLSTLGQAAPQGWDRVYASHTFHEIQMYYPMRVVRERQYKLIWNIAHPLPFPFASDLWTASTWQAQWQQGLDAPYGVRTVGQYVQRPEFELYDLQADPHEAHNLADQTEQAATLSRLKVELRQFQAESQDPWAMKWDYE